MRCPPRVLLSQYDRGETGQHPLDRHEGGVRRLPILFGGLQRQRLLDRVVAATYPSKSGQVRADAQTLAEIMRQRANVKAGRAFDPQPDAIGVDGNDVYRMSRDLHGSRESRWVSRSTLS